MINDISLYNSEMRKSLPDKLYFIKEIPICSQYIDFGCADGTLLRDLSRELPKDTSLIGFDISIDMLELARKKNPSLTFTNHWDYIKKNIRGDSCLILSSVIHEVYSYSSKEDIAIFWNRVFESGFKYICIRDMVPDDSINRKASKIDVQKCIRKQDEQIKEFEQYQGEIKNQKNLVHYLLKYRYEKNWDREVKENYFPVSTKELKALIPDTYKTILYESFILPFNKECIKKDFDIALQDNTHLKMILERKPTIY